MYVPTFSMYAYMVVCKYTYTLQLCSVAKYSMTFLLRMTCTLFKWFHFLIGLIKLSFLLVCFNISGPN